MNKHIKTMIDFVVKGHIKPTPYHEIDHTHCFHEKNPPCGQKIKHFKCCLCEMEHPDIAEKYAQGWNEGQLDYKHRWLNGEACTSCGEDLNSKTGLSDTCIKCLEND